LLNQHDFFLVFFCHLLNENLLLSKRNQNSLLLSILLDVDNEIKSNKHNFTTESVDIFNEIFSLMVEQKQEEKEVKCCLIYIHLLYIKG